MKHVAKLAAAAFFLTTSIAAAQTPNVQKAKFIPPVKGIASIEVMQLPSKKVGKDMVTVYKVRNTSKGSINLLKVDEFWYDKNVKIVSGTSYAHTKAPIKPGEIVEIVLASPYKAEMRQNQAVFNHANGKIEAKAVKALK